MLNCATQLMFYSCSTGRQQKKKIRQTIFCMADFNMLHFPLGLGFISVLFHYHHPLLNLLLQLKLHDLNRQEWYVLKHLQQHQTQLHQT